MGMSNQMMPPQMTDQMRQRISPQLQQVAQQLNNQSPQALAKGLGQHQKLQEIVPQLQNVAKATRSVFRR